MTTKSYPVPKPLWDALENVLMVKSKDLIKDIAKTLNQPEKPLVDAFKAKKHTFHLLDVSDGTDEKYQCEALLYEHAVAHRCRKATLLGQAFCPLHEFWKMPTLETKPVLHRITIERGENYFVDDKENSPFWTRPWNAFLWNGWKIPVRWFGSRDHVV